MSYFDHATMGQAFAGPGMDTRQWLSYGTVERETSDVKSVHFNDSDGSPLITGPLVSVRLHPSDVTVACRVGAATAGAGEGEWAPIGEGDEVLVAIPEGTERAGCVIIARLGNSLDAWPQSVAGQDATGNHFAFKRLRSPFILETASSYMVRSATTGASFTIDLDGNVIVSSGAQHQVVLRSDFVSMALGDGSAKVQMDPNDGTVLLYAGGGSTQFLVDGSASVFLSSGTLNVGTSGLGGSGHAVTLEQVLNLLINWTILLAGPQGSNTLATDLTAAGKLLSSAPSPFPQAFDTAIQAWLLQVVAPTPPTPTTAGGNLTQFLQTFSPAGLTAALAAQTPDPAALGLPTPIVPGIGRAGFLL